MSSDETQAEPPTHQAPYPLTLLGHLRRATEAHVRLTVPPAVEPADSDDRSEALTNE